MRIFTLHLIIIAIFLSATPTISQEYYVTGQAITSDYDTINIDIKEGKRNLNNKKLTYRLRTFYKKGKYKTATPSDILSFTHKKGYYISMPYENERQFMRLVISGPIKLYETFDKKGKTNLYVKKDSSNLIHLRKDNLKDQLKGILTGCTQAEFQKNINKIRYETFLIANLISQYNGCVMPDKYVSATFKPKARIELSALIAGVYNEFNYKFATGELNVIKMTPSFGLDFRIATGRRVNFGIDALYNNSEFDFDFEQIFSQKPTSEDLRKYKISNFTVSPYLNTTLSFKNNLSLRLGGTVSFMDIRPNGSYDDVLLNKSSLASFGAFIGLEYKVFNRAIINLDYGVQKNGSVFLFQTSGSVSKAEVGFKYKIN